MRPALPKRSATARAATLSALALIAACQPAASLVEAGASGSASGSKASPSVSAPAVGRKPVTEDDATALLEAWLKAQNTGRFPDYQALYASQFDGVRRSGYQVVRMNRARWMKEREGMFRNETKVSATDRKISVTPTGAEILFEQTWEQERYKDRGEKRMVLVQEGGQLRIAKEEMQNSRVTSHQVTSAEQFAVVLHAEGPQLVVDSSALEAWTAGTPSLVSQVSPVTTRRAVNPKAVPAAISNWSGRKVELYGPNGWVCEGSVASLSVLGRVTPHFGTTNRWKGIGDFAGQPPTPPSTLASEAWALSDTSRRPGESGRVVVGEVRAEKGDCKGALWGRPVGSTKAVAVAGVPADSKTRDLALAELRKTYPYSETQKTYESERQTGQPTRWEDLEPRISARVFEHPNGTRLITLSITARSSCGQFGATLSGIWKQQGTKLSTVRPVSDEELIPLSAVDRQGKGDIDLIFSEGILRNKDAYYRSMWKLVTPDLDCGC